mmetsp:Transcript_13496/g.49091  ORF Transcript_13496/g.49091 Transcript_13496/m.49091 type:complete len:1124 (+) Transcript_13496:172-3543(+)
MFEEWTESSRFEEDGINIYGQSGYGSQIATATTNTSTGGLLSPQPSTVQYDFDANAELLTVERPMFSVMSLQQSLSQGRGAVTCASAANDLVLVGTSEGAVLRYSYLEDVLTLEFEVPKQSSGSGFLGGGSHGAGGPQESSRVYFVSVDPSARHVVVCARRSQGFENYYFCLAASHGSSQRKAAVAKPIGKLKGHKVTAVGWNVHGMSDSSTGPVIVGTAEGKLFELCYEDKDKKEKLLRPLFQLGDIASAPTTPAAAPHHSHAHSEGEALDGATEREAVRGVEMESWTAAGETRWFVMAVTSNRYYLFTGAGSLEVVFASYSVGSDITASFVELPGGLSDSKLQFSRANKHAERFAWLAGPGIYHGNLSLSSNHIREESYLADHALLQYPKNSEEAFANEVPVSFVATKFHFMLLYPSKLLAVNRKNEAIVFEEDLEERYGIAPGTTCRLLYSELDDSIYMYTSSELFRIDVRDEDRNMWKVLLEKNEFVEALEMCKTDQSRDQVHASHAQYLMTRGQYVSAASYFAKATLSTRFEEVTLKFVELGQQDALRTFLLARLDRLDYHDRSQKTLLATWLTELYLDRINRLEQEVVPEKGLDGELIKDSENSRVLKSYDDSVNELYAFFSDHKDSLDTYATMQMLRSYGRLNELVHYAKLIGDWESVVQHHIESGDYRAALATLRRPSVPSELRYRYAPVLLEAAPSASVSSWIEAGDLLDCRRLIPALIRYCNAAEDGMKDYSQHRAEAMRYVEYCVLELQSNDAALHDLLVSLYAIQDGDDERKLLRFFAASVTDDGKALYDTKLALRVCREAGRLRSCVQIYCTIGMYEEALALALKVDLNLAKNVAAQVEDDRDLSKKLWLMIAKHVINEGNASAGTNGDNGHHNASHNGHFREAIAFLKETDENLSIEDILPCFPDFVLIDDFKDAICETVESYNERIRELKENMEEDTTRAEQIRKQQAGLRRRSILVERDTRCSRCNLPILTASTAETFGRSPLYVFPQGTAFHRNCLLLEAAPALHQTQLQVACDLVRRIDSRCGAWSSNAVTEGELQQLLSMSKPLMASLAAAHEALSIDELQEKLDDIIAKDNPHCGEAMIKLIDKPFIEGSEIEQGVLDYWSVD